ncbi:DUF3870 domain-containing protein [Geopsychrobacter electrodiphilus]|uniref:DUF3870 domain-containing protein n=1 Tax=Geopsychrobacter electrodiphilus TaxID=225196 RepID=UPI000374498F|nr:DUF3870 domain-containing protein [Geopsychrobacter electrodiphilus]
MKKNRSENVDLNLAETILVTGYAPSPQGTAMNSIYKYVGVILEIDPQTDRIINAEFTFVTSLARDFIARVIQGYHLKDGVEGLCQKIRTRYLAPSTEAVNACVKVAVQRYFDMKQVR